MRDLSNKFRVTGCGFFNSDLQNGFSIWEVNKQIQAIATPKLETHNPQPITDCSITSIFLFYFQLNLTS